MGAPFQLMPLPFADNALDPVISARTLSFHHGKHHQTYVTNLNNLLPGSPFEGKSLEAIVRGSVEKPDHKAIFNNAAQVWNHDFYWKSLTPKANKPKGRLLAKIEESFGGLEQLNKELIQKSIGQFGSGWAWLVYSDGKLKVTSTSNADTPLAHGVSSLLTIDVWEHAYYLDFQNRRADYATALVNQHLNWAFAEENFDSLK